MHYPGLPTPGPGLTCNFTPPTGFIPVEANVERGRHPPLNFLHHRRKAGGIAHPLSFTMHHLGPPSALANLKFPYIPILKNAAPSEPLPFQVFVPVALRVLVLTGSHAPEIRFVQR